MTRPLFCGFGGGLAVVLALGGGSPAVAQKVQPKPKTKAALPPLNAKVLDFARSKAGEQVGNGECWTLANDAVVAAGGKSSPAYTDAPGKEDYVWGELVVAVTVKGGKQTTEGTGTKSVLPGDIVQFRDAKFEGARPGGGTYSMTAPHHTAVVTTASPDGRVLGILHQNWNWKRTVADATLTLSDLKGGWVRVYRPQPR